MFPPGPGTNLCDSPVEEGRLVFGVVGDGLAVVGHGLFELPHVEVYIGRVEICQSIGGVQFESLLVVAHGVHPVIHELGRGTNKDLQTKNGNLFF